MFIIVEHARYVYYCIGLEVLEVAHDMQPQVSKYVTDELGLINSYDTWHGKSRSNVMLAACYKVLLPMSYRNQECVQGVEEGDSGQS